MTDDKPPAGDYEQYSDGTWQPAIVIRDQRIARTCPKDDCNWRSFGEPDATCPEHGKGQDQPDHPYNAGKDK